MSLFFTLLTLIVVPTQAKECLYPAVCLELQEQMEKCKLNLEDKSEFLKLVDIAKKSSELNCSVVGVKKKISSYQACFDQGIDKIDSELTPLKGPYPEEQVKSWFVFIQQSKFKEGADFTSSKIFFNSLNENWQTVFTPSTKERIPAATIQDGHDPLIKNNIK